MKHFEILNKLLNTVDLGEHTLTVKLNSGNNNIRLVHTRWSANISDDSFHASLVNQFCHRKLVTHGPDKGYSIDVETTLGNIKDSVLGTIMQIYKEACPSKDPRRTKLYKNILSLVRTAHRQDKLDLVNFMFDIAQYCHSVTKEMPLSDPSNKTHRNNIYKLFEIMENKHGSKTNSIQ
jgi:hypothetical protein